jgi:hypothetical protein
MFVNPMKMIAIAFASLVCFSVSATESGAVNTSAVDVAQSVNEMLRIDADRAILTEKKMLAEAQGRLGGSPVLGGTPGGNTAINTVTPEVEAPKTVVVPVRMEVLGIFGLGDNLLADVAIDNSKVRFKRGQSVPLGAGSNYPYRLVSINIPCVKIVEVNKTEHNVCLSKSGL